MYTSSWEDKIRLVFELGGWYSWDGCRWKLAEKKGVYVPAL